VISFSRPLLNAGGVKGIIYLIKDILKNLCVPELLIAPLPSYVTFLECTFIYVP